MSGGVTESPVAHADDGIVSVGEGEGLLDDEPKGRSPHPVSSAAPATNARARAAPAAAPAGLVGHTRITATWYVAASGSLVRRD